MARAVAIITHVLVVVAARAARAPRFVGDTECDYRPVACSSTASSPVGCLNEGLHGAGIQLATELAAQVPLAINTSSGAVLHQAFDLLSRVWSRHPGGIFLSFTLATEVYDAQYGLMNCSDAAKASDRPFCQECVPMGCALVLYMMDWQLHGTHFYYAYRIESGQVSPSPFWRDPNNTFIPQQSDAYLAVKKSLHRTWVPYWKPSEGLTTAAAPIFAA
jgi:hypothetical protein